jgi:beta-glucosidase
MSLAGGEEGAGRASGGPFPADFVWGAATAAYQIEGSPLADGAGPSIWHRFAHTPGKMVAGDTGDLACDHYRRYRGDVDLMHDLGLRAYRFSVSWPRVLPAGRGRANERGLDFYRRLVDALLERGIEPFVTLYHWDLPAAIDDRGGWLNPDVAGWFADYATLMVRTLGDRVRHWITLNEPWVAVDAGYLYGAHAPGHSNLFEAPIAAHNLLRAHGEAVRACRAAGAAKVGIAVNLEPKHPASRSEPDLRATARAEAYLNRHYLDPIFFAQYPQELSEIYGPGWLHDPDMSGIDAPLDFLGINYYSRRVVREDHEVWPVRASDVVQPTPATDLGWEVYPDGLTEILAWVTQRYGRPPLYITENGAGFHEPGRADGGVLDPARVSYLRRHIAAAAAAIEAGADLRGYFVWSLLDNLEWTFGFAKRFGIVHVDFETGVRTPKDSARFYAEVIATNGAAALHDGGLAPEAPPLT